MIIENERESQEDRFQGAFRITVPSPAPIRKDDVLFSRMKRAERLVGELRDLNRKRLTKIKRLREGIRSLQACHERDQREILNLRQKLAEAGLKITRLERLGLDDDDE